MGSLLRGRLELRLAVATVIALLAGTTGQGVAPASAAEPLADEASPGEAIVRFRDDASAEERSDARAGADVTVEQSLPVVHAQLVELDAGTSVTEGVRRLERQADVLYAEPNYVRRADRSPNDSLFGQQWGLHNTGQAVLGYSGTPDADVDAPEAWDAHTGGSGVTVAVVDTGVDASHPDLNGNIWTNPQEASGQPGVDDDRNGEVDDQHGWDFVGEPRPQGGIRTEDNDPQDPEGHGTHVAGIIGAEGDNGEGVAGVSWDVSLMPLRVLDENGSGTVADVLEGYAYAVREGADVINASLGGDGHSRTEADFFNANPDALFVVAAGNDARDDDAQAQFPCNQPQQNVVCVAASDRNDGLAGFSNYGRANVDLAAPGERILSTFPRALTPAGQQPYAYFNGTSMATPHVAGAAALIASRYRGASVAEIRSRLLGTVDAKDAFGCRTFTGGRLNVGRALSDTAPTGLVSQAPCPPPVAAGEGERSSGSGAQTSGGGSTGGSAGAPATTSPLAASPPAAPAAPPRGASLGRCSSLHGRRRAVCLRRFRVAARCAGLATPMKRGACVRRARRALR